MDNARTASSPVRANSVVSPGAAKLQNRQFKMCSRIFTDKVLVVRPIWLTNRSKTIRTIKIHGKLKDFMRLSRPVPYFVIEESDDCGVSKIFHESRRICFAKFLTCASKSRNITEMNINAIMFVMREISPVTSFNGSIMEFQFWRTICQNRVRRKGKRESARAWIKKHLAYLVQRQRTALWLRSALRKRTHDSQWSSRGQCTTAAGLWRMRTRKRNANANAKTAWPALLTENAAP